MGWLVRGVKSYSRIGYSSYGHYYLGHLVYPKTAKRGNGETSKRIINSTATTE